MEIGISTASYFNKLQIEDAILDIGAHIMRARAGWAGATGQFGPLHARFGGRIAEHQS